LLGYAEGTRVAARFGLDTVEVEELLLDFEAFGWVSRTAFAGSRGWSLTERGRLENERRLAAELQSVGGGSAVEQAHAAFLPLNARFQEVVTRWQVRPLHGSPMAANDHTDFRWDGRVIEALGTAGRRLETLCADLSAMLTRFDGYTERYAAALAHVEAGERRWVDGVGFDSCHVVWMQLHEDLLATLGIERGQEA
jgi:hypothetical protein